MRSAECCGVQATTISAGNRQSGVGMRMSKKYPLGACCGGPDVDPLPFGLTNHVHGVGCTHPFDTYTGGSPCRVT